MKTSIALLVLSLAVHSGFTQNFNKNLAAARSAYAAGNLNNSRFAMTQMLNELDAAIGKEILKILPPKLETLAANTKADNTTGSSGSVGLFVHRTYGTAPKTATIDIINNSPLITSLNALLAVPLLANVGNPDQKIVRVQGYKGILHKTNGENGKVSYDLQIPLQNTLFTLKADDTKEADILRFAEAVPLEKIAQMAK